MAMHALLARQIRRHGIDPDRLDPQLEALIQDVSQAYADGDDDRAMLEHALDLSSEELSEANAELRAMVQAFPDLVFRVDAQGRILEARTQADDDLLCPARQLRGRRLDAVPVPQVAALFREALARAHQQRVLVAFEYQLTVSGQDGWYEARVVPMPNGELLVIIRNITVAKHGERALIESEERKCAILGAAQDAIIDLDDAGRVAELNPAAEQLFLSSAGEMRGQRLLDLAFADDAAAEVGQRLPRSLGGGGPEGNIGWIETRGRRPGGAEFPMEYSLNRIRLDHGYGYTAFFRDLTERQRAERDRMQVAREQAARAEAQAAHRKIETILDSITDAFFALDHQGRLTYANHEAERVLGRPRSDLTSLPLGETLPPGDSSSLLASVQQARDSQAPAAFEAYYTRPERWIAGRVYPHSEGVSIYFRDITEQRHAAAALQASAERYRMLFESATDMIYTHTLNGEIISFNQEAQRCTGYSLDDLVGSRIVDIVAPDYRAEAMTKTAQKLQGLPVTRYELVIVGKDGRRIPVEVSSSLIVVNGTPVGVQGIARDITMRKEAEARLRQAQQALEVSQARFRALSMTAPVGILAFNAAGECDLANATWESLTGVSSARALGNGWLAAIPRADREVVRILLLRALEEGADGSCDLQLRRPDGATRYVQLRVRSLGADEEATAGVVMALEDVTVFIETERERQTLLDAVQSEAEKLRQLDQVKSEVVSIVSHELRTPLASLIGFTELLLGRPSSADEQKKYLQIMREESWRLAALLDEFLDLQRLESGASAMKSESVDLAALAAHARETLGDDPLHPLVLDSAPGLATVTGDPDRLLQVITNLVTNARKYSPDGGSVTLRVGASGGEAWVEVQDSGLGIPSDALPHLFNKFFRVESDRHRGIRGTGLGLMICRRIVEAHRGRIWAQSDGLGAGSRFVFTVPTAPLESTHSEATSGETMLHANTQIMALSERVVT